MACKVYCPTAEIQDIGVVPEEGYNPYFFPAEGAYLPFFFTDETFMKVLSALVNGAQVTYGDEGRAVVWEFLRNVEFPVSLCQAIADCINDPLSPARQAIIDLVTTSPDISNYFTTNVQGLTTEQIGSNVLSKGCDNGVVAGAVIELVDVLDGYNIDALQIVEVGTNDEERIASFIAGIPIFGALPVDEIFDVLQDFLEDFSENYAAAVTPEWKNEVSEDLYCLAKQSPDCQLTFEQLYVYFQDRAVSGLDLFATVYDLANFITGGDFINDELIASGMYAVLLASVKTGSEFFGMNLPKIGAITRDAGTSSAWEDWDECGVPPVGDCLDFAASQQGWNPIGGRGIYQPGQGLAPLGPLDGYVFYWGGPAPYEGESSEIVMHATVATTNWRLLGGAFGTLIAVYDGDATANPTFNEDNAVIYPLPNVGGYRLIPTSEVVPAGFILEELCFTPIEP